MAYSTETASKLLVSISVSLVASCLRCLAFDSLVGHSVEVFLISFSWILSIVTIALCTIAGKKVTPITWDLET